MAAKLPAGLYGIADAAFGDPSGHAIALAEAGCATVQLRAKHWSIDQVHAAAKSIAGPLKTLGTCFIINDHPEVALAVRADGVHLGQDDTSVAQARALLPAQMLVGLSTHDLKQAVSDHGADYIGFGPIYATDSKADALSPRGPATLAHVVAHAPCPVVAIGGISRANIQEVQKTGAAAWACIGALYGCEDLFEAVSAMQRA